MVLNQYGNKEFHFLWHFGVIHAETEKKSSFASVHHTSLLTIFDIYLDGHRAKTEGDAGNEYNSSVTRKARGHRYEVSVVQVAVLCVEHM